MAERRMFAKTIIDSDAFLDMPQSTQLLYFHLSMRGDDDGFINNPKKIARMIGASDDDLKLLAVKKFIIPFDSGVVVIKHWKIHNYIRNDRYIPTKYLEEMGFLELDENKAYRKKCLGIPNGYQMDTNGIPRIGKYSIGEDSVGQYVSTGARTRESDVDNSVIVENSVDNPSGEEETPSEDEKEEEEADGQAGVRADRENELRLIGGTIGQGVLLMSDRQMEELIELMGLPAFNEYATRLSNYIINKDAKVRSCAATIRRWWQEDESKAARWNE